MDRKGNNAIRESILDYDHKNQKHLDVVRLSMEMTAIYEIYLYFVLTDVFFEFQILRKSFSNLFSEEGYC